MSVCRSFACWLHCFALLAALHCFACWLHCIAVPAGGRQSCCFEERSCFGCKQGYASTERGPAALRRLPHANPLAAATTHRRFTFMAHPAGFLVHRQHGRRCACCHADGATCLWKPCLLPPSCLACLLACSCLWRACSEKQKHVKSMSSQFSPILCCDLTRAPPSPAPTPRAPPQRRG